MKKYAVYRSPTGLYCYDYIDRVEDLKDTGFEDIITEEQLPIVLDGTGGYFRFEFGDFRFVKIIESDEEFPLKLEDMFYKNDPHFKLGWMSPDGDTYSCSYTNHNKCAIMLARKFFPKSKYPETALERAGWLKIIDSWDGTSREHGTAESVSTASTSTPATESSHAVRRTSSLTSDSTTIMRSDSSSETTIYDLTQRRFRHYPETFFYFVRICKKSVQRA